MNAHGIRWHRLSAPSFAELQKRSAFELGKWDQQYHDRPTLSEFALELEAPTYQQLAAWAEALAGELLRAEREILARPTLLNHLALPGRVKQALRTQEPGRAPRLCRFDFHPTEDGWRISEVNSDVPGGLLESDGLPRLLAENLALNFLPNTTSLYLDALLAEGTQPHPIALVHATAYTDDRQVMEYLRRELEARGQQAILASPDNLRWEKTGVRADTAWYAGEVSRLVRFYPGEWMANLPSSCRWMESAGIGGAWMSNPLQSLISQSKRFPLTWDHLREPMATWRQLLPETRAMRRTMLARRKEWIFKPALGRVGEGIFLHGVSRKKETRASLAGAFLHPRHWVAQRAFRATGLDADGETRWPCLGIYTVDEKAAGIYARVARKPLVDGAAQDAAVFLTQPASLIHRRIHETAGTF